MNPETGKSIQVAIGKTVNRTFDETVTAVETALAEHGFGILCRIDVREKLKEKLGVDIPDYLILGACVPRLAHRAVTHVPEIGVLLPCNCVVRRTEDGKTRVEAINAAMMSELLPGEEIEAVAGEVFGKLDRVLEAI